METLIGRLNPTAELIRTDHGVVDLGDVLGTGRDDPVAAAAAPGWDEEIAGGHSPETEEYGISSMTFRSGRPFHPQRLADAIAGMRRVLRSKGFCWIGIRLDRDEVAHRLESAVLTDAELAEGPRSWARYPDPLPAWGVTRSHPH